MKCVIIYNNTPETKQGIWSKLVEWSKHINLQDRGINGNGFQIVNNWPSSDSLNTFPLNFQVEEVLIQGDKITTTKQLVIDVETNITLENSPVQVLEQLSLEPIEKIAHV